MAAPSGRSGRFDDLTEGELELTRFAYQQVAKRIMDRAAADDYEAADLAGAAATFHMVSTLANEVGRYLGERTPPAETLDMAASCIALGQAPMVAAVETEIVKAEARRALGRSENPAADDGPSHGELVASYKSEPGSTTPEDR